MPSIYMDDGHMCLAIFARVHFLGELRKRMVQSALIAYMVYGVQANYKRPNYRKVRLLVVLGTGVGLTDGVGSTSSHGCPS